ncbi:hypothetical protein BB560_003131 [Smittium megazygosporum]|uniref:Large ribosomal subunit protein mL45 n=1 Tax=Smittium megazygosporum TaxID=133381 RepID=A0A2T9ZCW0_9FUNG|nr:hypothetical protein BB560_003131 [Smittium megazygosporum]
MSSLRSLSNFPRFTKNILSAHIHSTSSFSNTSFFSIVYAKSLFQTKSLLTPAAIQSRFFATKDDIPRFLLTENGLLGDYIPVPKEKRPSIYSKIGFKIAINNWKNAMKTTYSIGTIKRKISGWSPKQFALDAQEMYEAMNEAFAEGDRRTLEELCMINMLSKLKGDMKKRVGRYEWKKVSDISKPRIVQARTGRLTQSSTLCQVVVRIEQLQSVVVYNRANKPILGDKNKPIPVTEYVVFQKTTGDVNTPWMIYGKLEETKFFIPVKK